MGCQHAASKKRGHWPDNVQAVGVLVADGPIHIPLTSGLDQSVDSRVQAPSSLAAITNGYFKRSGVVAKRNGFTSRTNTIDGGALFLNDQGPVKGIFSTGDHLCVRGHRSLYVWVDNESSWYDRGDIAPCTADLQTRFHDQLDYSHGDMCVVGNYVCYIAQGRRQTSSAGAYATRIVLRVDTDDGDVVIPTQVAAAEDATAGTRPHAPMCVAVDDHMVYAFLEGTTAGTQQLSIDDVVPPSGTMTGGLNITTAYSTGNVGQRTYCLAEETDGNNYFLAYIDNTTVPAQGIEVSKRAATHSSSATATLTHANGYDVVACCHDAANSALYVFAAQSTATGTLDLWALNDTTLATAWGPRTIDTLAGSPETVSALGVCVGSNGSSDRITCVWQVFRPGGAVNNTNWAIDNVSVRTSDGLDADGIQRIPNCALRAGPWVQDDRHYILCNTSMPMIASNSTVVLDLNPDNTHAVGEQDYRIAAVVDPAVAPNAMAASAADSPSYTGAANHVTVASNVARMASTSIAFVQNSTTLLARHSVDELKLDYREVPTSITTGGGAALMGGGFISWFAGVGVEELGFAHPPAEAAGQQTSQNDGSGSLVASTDYDYQLVWGYFDVLGTLHRSMPSVAFTVQCGVGHDSIDIVPMSLGATNRHGQNIAYEVYRSINGVFTRVSPPVYMLPNDPDAQVCAAFRDLGTSTNEGASIYTTDGAELEAVMPAGADFPLVAAERVWLAGFPRRERLQYSKRITPSSANEDQHAPEFHENQTLVMPSGQKCTALGTLDDKVIVFTEDKVYAMAGRGPDPGGRNNDFSDLTLISSDAGCIDHRSVVSMPAGMYFQSKAGIYALSRDLRVKFAGDRVRDELETYPVVTSATVVASAMQVRFTITNTTGTSGEMLVFDYRIGEWSVWQPKDSGGNQIAMVGACMHEDTDGVERYYAVESDGSVWREDETTWYDDATQYVPLTVETAWLSPAQQSGWHRTREVTALASRKDHHDFSMALFSDFEPTADNTYTWAEATITALPQPAVREQLAAKFPRQKATAIKVRLSDAASASTTTGQGYEVVGLRLGVRGKRGPVKTPNGASN